jgi:hypothetical protein
MHLQVLAQRARVPLRRHGDGCIALHFPPILAAPTVLFPGSTLNFSKLFLKHDTSGLLEKRLFAAQDIFSDNASVRSAEKSQIFLALRSPRLFAEKI